MIHTAAQYSVPRICAWHTSKGCFLPARTEGSEDLGMRIATLATYGVHSAFTILGGVG